MSVRTRQTGQALRIAGRRRHLCRRDENQGPIVEALRKVGASVFDVASLALPFDLIVGFRGFNYLLDAKNPDTRYGRKGLSESQKEFNAAWNGAPIVPVSSAVESLESIGAVTPVTPEKNPVEN